MSYTIGWVEHSYTAAEVDELKAKFAGERQRFAETERAREFYPRWLQMWDGEPLPLIFILNAAVSFLSLGAGLVSRMREQPGGGVTVLICISSTPNNRGMIVVGRESWESPFACVERLLGENEPILRRFEGQEPDPGWYELPNSAATVPGFKGRVGWQLAELLAPLALGAEQSAERVA